MIIKFTNGVELNPISVIGEKRYIQGTSRDTLTFVFPVETSLDMIDALFTPANCAKIIIVEDENNTEYIHSGYSIRAELKREPIEIEPATDTTEAVYENRVTVSMSQLTYSEQQLAHLTEQSNMLEECIVEMAGIVYA